MKTTQEIIEKIENNVQANLIIIKEINTFTKNYPFIAKTLQRHQECMQELLDWINE